MPHAPHSVTLVNACLSLPFGHVGNFSHLYLFATLSTACDYPVVSLCSQAILELDPGLISHLVVHCMTPIIRPRCLDHYASVSIDLYLSDDA